MLKKTISIIYFLLMSIFLNAQDNITVDDITMSEIEYQIKTYTNGTKSLQEQEEYNKAFYAHQKELMTIIETAYSTQQIITVLIFCLVVILVLGGFWLSYLQFKADIVKNKNSEEKTKASFKIGKEGMEFSSSVIGLIVLFMSFFFFHLYVKDVYSIKVNKTNFLNEQKSTQSIVNTTKD